MGQGAEVFAVHNQVKDQPIQDVEHLDALLSHVLRLCSRLQVGNHFFEQVCSCFEEGGSKDLFLAEVFMVVPEDVDHGADGDELVVICLIYKGVVLVLIRIILHVEACLDL